MTKLLVVLSIFTAFSASANLMSQYDVLMQGCLNGPASSASEDQVRGCHEQVKSELLIDFATLDRYLSCVDYGHSATTIDQEADCLRQL